MKRTLFTLLLIVNSLFSFAQIRIAILPMVDKGASVSAGMSAFLLDNITSAIAETDGYEAYDRVDLASIMDEQKFQRTGNVSDDQIKEIGVMTGASFVLVTTVAPFNAEKMTASGKILHVETAQVFSSGSVLFLASGDDVVSACQTLIGKLLKSKKQGVSGVLQLEDGRYEGEILEGKANGRGTLIYKEDDGAERVSYVGEFKNGEQSGKGVMTWTDGGKYEGNWSNGVRNGFGTHHYSNGRRYEGNWVNDKRNGTGKDFMPDGDRYEGNFVNGAYEGYGVYYWADGGRYEGNWKNDKRNGKGKYFNKGGGRYEGDFVDGKYEGYGVYYWANGERYEGNWKNDKQNGQGVLWYAEDNNRLKWAGVYEDGNWSEGVLYYKDGSFTKGTWNNGKMNGPTEYNGLRVPSEGYRKVGERVDGEWKGWVKKYDANGRLLESKYYK